MSTLEQAAAEVQQHQVFENRIQKMQEEETTFFFSIGHYSHHNKGITTSSREAGIVQLSWSSRIRVSPTAKFQVVWCPPI